MPGQPPDLGVSFVLSTFHFNLQVIILILFLFSARIILFAILFRFLFRLVPIDLPKCFSTPSLPVLNFLLIVISFTVYKRIAVAAGISAKGFPSPVLATPPQKNIDEREVAGLTPSVFLTSLGYPSCFRVTSHGFLAYSRSKANNAPLPYLFEPHLPNINSLLTALFTI
jgi:hypothetical protein